MSNAAALPGLAPAEEDAAYAALRTRDSRFDGRLFVGVTSTGIYCRPVCRVRLPMRRNCRFFSTRMQAEAQGFRPCLRCRPELAPGLSLTDASQSLAHAAARLLDQALQEGRPCSQPELAAQLGVSDRHLRRIFQAEHGLSPHAYLATQRLLLAKQLLADTRLPVAQVALASGHGSLRRFNAAMQQRWRLSPSDLRRAQAPRQRVLQGEEDAPGIALRLAWRGPLDAQALLGHFARRALAGHEQVDLAALRLRRSLALSHGGQALQGWLQLQLDLPAQVLRLTVSTGLAPALAALLQRTRQALDLDADPAAIDPVLARLPLAPRPGLRLPGSFCGFESAVRVVLGQQVSVAGARTLAQRLLARFGRPLADAPEGLELLFPDAATLAAADPADIGRLGIVRQRVRALQALAGEVAAGRLVLAPGAPLAPTLAALQALPGIGDWTAQVIAMRCLAWPDAWPARDIGLMNALGSRDPGHITRLAEAWRPWRAYAVMRLWHRIETGE